MALEIVQRCEENGLFSKSQFGFSCGRDAVKGILRHQYSTVHFCDLSKAFDSVSAQSVGLIPSYLSQRSQMLQCLDWRAPGFNFGPYFFFNIHK